MHTFGRQQNVGAVSRTPILIHISGCLSITGRNDYSSLRFISISRDKQH